MYSKYHTEGIVLGNVPLSESSKIFFIFTDKLGLVRASAKSVRQSGAKLKAGLEDHTSGRFTFIRGKQGWKVTDTLPEKNIFFSMKGSPNLTIYARFSFLLKKLLPEEEPNSALFSEFKSDIFFLLENEISEDHLKNIECLAIMRFLNYLGYLEEKPWIPFIKSQITLELLDKFSPLRKDSIETINHSLRASQLV